MAALNLAPADDRLSAVEPNMTRGNVVYLMRDQLNYVPPTFIDLTPHIARKVAMVLQDCPDPVELRFAYDQQGNITVGWNREEVEIRKGLRPRPGAVPLKELMRLRELAMLGSAKATAMLRAQCAPVPKPLAPAPAPEPKPAAVDPSDPKFVLKRPKL